jgi:phosphoribosylanthranilate isomerase
MTVEAKICGVGGLTDIECAAHAGARYVGFVFYPRSPRNLTPEQAGALAAATPSGIMTVALLVDPDDAAIDAVLEHARIDLLQLHGGESPGRIAAIKRRTGVAVMKAIKISDADDLEAATPYLGVADRLLFDAKAPATLAGAMPGGNALSFDWALLAGRAWPCPWMLSGGLDPDNVAEAIRVSGAPAVDVSSGVESAPGVKDPARIEAFLGAVERCRHDR